MNRLKLGAIGIFLTFVLIVSFVFLQADKGATLQAASVHPSHAVATNQVNSLDQHALDLYHKIGLDRSGLSFEVFQKGLIGFYNLKDAKTVSDKSILSIVDFDQISTSKRLYIIDLDKETLILNTWVAHGQNSGWNTAESFSNVLNSYESSLGFYVTGEVYYGKHGRSLRLDGMDAGFNDQARNRAIVLHGADYVSAKTIRQLGRLGRSQGCPAVPLELTDQVINAVHSKTVLYIHKTLDTYQSKFLDSVQAARYLSSTNFFNG